MRELDVVVVVTRNEILRVGVPRERGVEEQEVLSRALEKPFAHVHEEEVTLTGMLFLESTERTGCELALRRHSCQYKVERHS